MAEIPLAARPQPPRNDDAPRSTPPLGAGDRLFSIPGMDCAAEVAALERELLPLVNGDRTRLYFDVLAGRMTVRADSGLLPDAVITAAVSRTGLRADPLGARRGSTSWWHSRGRAAAVSLAGAATLAGMVVHALSAEAILAPFGLSPSPSELPQGAVLLYLLATVSGLLFVAPRAWAALRSLRGDMHLLMTVAVAGAIGLGEYLESASVSFLFALSLQLEMWSVGRARRAVQALLELAPPMARRRGTDGQELLLPLHEMHPGEDVVVHAGERVPLDGIVVDGVAHVDSSPITGEARPAEAEAGTEVYAGSVCLDGTLVVRVTRPAGDTLLARIVRRVTEARRHRARSERWVDRFARIYTPVVFAAAAGTALLPPVLGLGTWEDWLYRSLVLLVIGCPCALVISTPVSVVAGLAAAARAGVLVKGGDVLEVPARVGVVAFDKTGTLTTGALRVEEVIPLNGNDARDVLAVAAALNDRNSHPVGRAIVAFAAAHGIVPPAATGIRLLPGRGAEGWVGGASKWVGSSRLLQERGTVDQDALRLARTAAAGGRSVVLVGAHSTVCGLVVLSDTPRDESLATVRQLFRLGISRIALLTGDTQEAAEVLGEALEIPERFARLLPDDKVRMLGRLRHDQQGMHTLREPSTHSHPLVAFVGDGVNDAPALAAADLGIAMGEGGTDVALETADIALVSANLNRIPWLISHSRRVVAVIRANIIVALSVKGVFVVMATTGHATLWAAIAADMGASLLVIANGLRLLRPPSSHRSEVGRMARPSERAGVSTFRGKNSEG